MTLKNLEKAPWPWFGGKADAAPAVWAALGDVHHYVEPFAGSLAVLLRRPHEANRTYYSETVNDIDGLLVNAWRAMRSDPEAMARAASWPVSESDLHARHLALLAWREAGAADRLAADPDYYDAKMGGWWAWGQSCWIGSGWCSGDGPWIVGANGRIEKRSRSKGTREPGVSRQIPHLTGNGMGVNRPQTREPGVSRQIPHLSNDGMGVNRPQTREPGVGDYHPMTMPELLKWFQFLSARLRHVRILNGDWKRACTNGALKTLRVRQKGVAGVFLDPPYGDVRTSGLYASDDLSVAAEVQAWCRDVGDDPKLRIVLAGFDSEHSSLVDAGWREVEWFRNGFLTGGMANTAGTGKSQQKRERLWMSPHCLGKKKEEEEEDLPSWLSDLE